MYAKILDEMIARLEKGPTSITDVLGNMMVDPRCSEKAKEYIANMMETLGTIRMSLKYLMFDLEATRRENAELIRMLEGRDD